MRDLIPALFVLECVLDRGNSLSEAYRRAHAMYNLSEADRVLLTRAVNYELRHHLLLRAQVAEALPRFENSETQLRLGCLLLSWLRDSDRLDGTDIRQWVINTSQTMGLGFTEDDFDLLQKVSFEPSKAPEKYQDNPLAHNALLLNCPEWVLEAYTRQFGTEGAARLLRRAGQPSPLYLTVNTLKADASTFAKDPRYHLVESISPSYQGGASLRALTRETEARHSREVKEGLVFPQDISWFRFLDAVSLPQYCRVLHVHAREGYIAAALALRASRQEGKVEANFPTLENMDRAKVLHDRLGVNNVRPVVSSTQMLKTSLPFDSYDTVVVTPTSSHLGMASRRPEILPSFDADRLSVIIQSQREELLEASFFTARGGILAYAVPSILSEETDQVVESFLSERKEYRLLTRKALLQEGKDYGYSLYYAILERTR